MTIDLAKFEIPVEKLRWQCDPAVFDFECTKDIAALREFIGQDRAIRAIEFGLGMSQEGYNIYVAGLTGTGKTSIVKAYVEKLVKERQSGEKAYRPSDWCYVYNFGDPDRPQALSLPQGNGKAFRDQVAGLLQRLKEELAKAFSSEEYKSQRKQMIEESAAEQQKLVEEVSEEAQRKGFLLQIAPVGPALIPLVDGKPMSQTDYIALKEATRRELESRRNELLKKLEGVFDKVREVERQVLEKALATDRAIADFTVSREFESLVNEYKDRDSDKITQYLNDLKAFTLGNLDIFKERPEQQQLVMGVPAAYLMHGRDPFLPFHVNVFVDNSATKGPPVIVEPNPTYPNLFGKIERRFLFGGYLSDHTMLKPGALQLANGGYLLLSARDVLTNPGVWPALKRAIKTEEVRIEDPFEQFGLIAPQGMRPQPMPVVAKVVLIGDGQLYQLLAMYDEDFWEIFKVKADFNFEVNRTAENMRALAGFIAGCCEDCKIHHFDRTGVAKVVEYASRMVADQDKLSSRFAQLKDLVMESEFWSVKDGASLVAAKHVEKAVEEKLYRHNLPDEQIKEMISKGTIMIDVTGSVTGQVNGLSVYMLGDVVFGKPSRITCKTFLGRGGIINIERESQLSGRIHDKGVLILSGYLGSKYAQDSPLSLSASLCFEQSYEGVEGDSASSTELYALLSSISGVPLRQDIAVTGSVNQRGEIQPIGGVNQKVEGFFGVCQAMGLTGQQGVIIPQRNARNLMLKHEVLNAVREGKFHVYAVNTVDEGIEVLTGIEAGVRKEDGAYPEGTLNYRVDKQLKEMAAKLKQFALPPGDKEVKTEKPEACPTPPPVG